MTTDPSRTVPECRWWALLLAAAAAAIVLYIAVRDPRGAFLTG